VTLPLSYSRLTAVVRGQWSGISLFSQMKADSIPSPRLDLIPDSCSLFPIFLELMTRIELVTSPLPRECSTN
jgi:hypothetical protein